LTHAGFDYEFNSLQSKKDELSSAFTAVVSSGSASTTPSRFTTKTILMTLAPSLLSIVRLTFLFNDLSLQYGNSAITRERFQESPISQEGFRPYLQSTHQRTKNSNASGTTVRSEREIGCLRKGSLDFDASGKPAGIGWDE
jgi:hypothetical protein